jgi:hypothetical protein
MIDELVILVNATLGQDTRFCYGFHIILVHYLIMLAALMLSASMVFPIWQTVFNHKMRNLFHIPCLT